jgi:predicted Zn-dependent peptidase
MTNKPKATEYFSEIRPLSKGGKLAVEVMPGMESFTLGFFFPVGAANESAGISGVSHFIEHMVFKGSKRRTPKQIVQAIERVGGLINASTGREAT